MWKKVFETIIGMAILFGITAILSLIASWMIKVLNHRECEDNEDD